MTRPRRSRRLLPACLGLVGVAAVALWPRGGGMAQLTSEPVMINGKTVRFLVRGPADWRITALPNPASAADFLLASPPHFPWLPARLRRWFGVDLDDKPMALVVLGEPGVALDALGHAYNKGLSGYHLAVKPALGPQGGAIEYRCKDQKLFDATCDQVCDSFRVIPQ